MKKFILLWTAVLIVFFSACDTNTGNSTTEDSVINEPPTGPAPDNSNATNPSMPNTDTAFIDSTIH